MAAPDLRRAATATDLARIIDILTFLSERDARQAGGLDVPPVVVGGSFDSSGRFHTGQVGVAGRAIADQDVSAGQQLPFMLDHSRKLSVKDSRWWDWIPEGRTVVEDRFQNTISWVATTGTVAYNATRPFPGNPNMLRLTTGAVLNDQAAAGLGLFRLADAQSRGLGGTLAGNGPKIWFGVLWRPADANTAFIQLTVNLFDGVRHLQAAVRLLTPSGQLQTLDPGAGFSSRGTAVALSTAERWHWLGMELHYQSGLTTLAYVRLRADDVVVDLDPYAPASNAAATTVNETLLEISTQNDAALAAITDIGYAVVKDLTNVRNILG